MQLSNPLIQVTIHLGGACPSVKVYDPTIGTTAIQIHSEVASLTLTLSDHPVVIEIKLH